MGRIFGGPISSSRSDSAFGGASKPFVLVGFGLIVATKNNIREYDELQKKITLEALAITLGVVFVVGIPYQLISDYDIVPFRANLTHLYFLMGLTLLTSLYLGMRRYR